VVLACVTVQTTTGNSQDSIQTLAFTAGNSVGKTFVDVPLDSSTWPLFNPNGGFSTNVHCQYAKNVAAGSGANTDVITLTTNGNSSWPQVMIAEVGSVSTTAPIDKMIHTINASSTSPSAGAFSPTLSGEVAVGVIQVAGAGTLTSGAGFTAITSGSSNNGGEYKTSVSSSVNLNWTTVNSAFAISLAVLLK
jgi:hypothetical protein